MMSPSIQKTLVLYLACLACLLTSIDVTAVNLILVPIAQALHFPVYKTQWIMNAYLLTYSTLIIAGGRFGDMLGDKKILLMGLGLFFAGSGLTACAHGLNLIIVGRLIQGFSGALIVPNATAIIFRIYPKEQQGYVSGISSSLIGIGVAVGPFLGGLLTQLSSWRLIFIINLPLTVLIFIAIAFLVTRTSPAKKASGSTLKALDLPGIVFLGITLLVLLYLVSSLGHTSDRPFSSLSLLVILFVAGIAFVFNQKHTKNPLIHVELLTNPVVVYASLLRFLYGLPIMVFVYFIALYLQNSLGYAPMNAGLMFLPFTAALVFLSPYVGKWVDKNGYIAALLFGCVLSIIAFFLFIFVGTTSPWYWIDGLIFLSGLGVSIVRPPMVAAAIKATPKEHLGLVNSISSTLTNMGGAVGIALASTMMLHYTKQGGVDPIGRALTPIMSLSIGVFFCIMAIVFFGLRPLMKKVS